MTPPAADAATVLPAGPAPAGTSPLIRLHEGDNVLVAREPLAIGRVLLEFGLRLKAQVPAGHKIAARRIAAGEPVKKYDTVIGAALRDIEAGEHVHGHNLGLVDFARDPGFCQDVRPVAYVPEAERASFLGIVRPDGRVATRNFIGLISSVNCSATVIKKIAEHFTPERLAAYPNVDGVVAFAQTSGCGMSSPSEHFDVLRRTIAGYASHPNLAAVLIVGLGCERNQVADLVASQGLTPGERLRTYVMQDTGGTRATIAEGIRAIEAMLPAANDVRRVPVPASHLKIGLECGGSDGFSGITANPALGAAMDILVRHGGTAILSETPEIHGVEYMLTRRAVTPEVGQKLLDRLAWWEHYTRGHNGQFNGVVGPGNQARRAGQHLREIARLGHEGRHHAAAGGVRVRRADRAKRLRVHGFARLRPGGHHWPDRQRRQPDLLHHRPRLHVRQQAGAHHQAGQQHADVHAPGGGHGHQLRRHPRRRAGRGADGRAHLPPDPAPRQRREDQERAARPGRPRVRALAHGHRQLTLNSAVPPFPRI